MIKLKNLLSEEQTEKPDRKTVNYFTLIKTTSKLKGYKVGQKFHRYEGNDNVYTDSPENMKFDQFGPRWNKRVFNGLFPKYVKYTTFD